MNRPTWLAIAMWVSAACSRPPSATPVSHPAQAAVHDAQSAVHNAQATGLDAQLSDCCRQCLQASQRDPAGFDISRRPCSRYQGEWNGAPGVDPSCATALQRQQATVQSCRTLLEPSAQ